MTTIHPLSPFAPGPSMVNSVVRNTSRGIVRDARLREVVLYCSIVPRILQEGCGMLQSLILVRIQDNVFERLEEEHLSFLFHFRTKFKILLAALSSAV